MNLLINNIKISLDHSPIPPGHSSPASMMTFSVTCLHKFNTAQGVAGEGFPGEG